MSGVAPLAWLVNYRVFNTPTPTGYDAFTPQIVAAFESAVTDGMDVINFSGGGPQVDPISDALVEAVRNVANAGVVPVIAAGNDRDDWGLGSVGSPGTAPDAISVAAVSNSHVFTPSLNVTTSDAPATLKNIPFQDVLPIPAAWTSADQTLTDVGTIVGTDGSPVERHLCGSAANPNSRGTLPPASASGMILLVSRGICAFTTKAANAEIGGSAGIVLVDNRPGEANFIPLQLPLDAGMVSDLDGARLRAYFDSRGGRAAVRFVKAFNQLNTGRSGIITSFSSAGPTDFGHQLKPDLAAPGGQILSATLPEALGEPFECLRGGRRAGTDRGLESRQREPPSGAGPVRRGGRAVLDAGEHRSVEPHRHPHRARLPTARGSGRIGEWLLRSRPRDRGPPSEPFDPSGGIAALRTQA